MSHDFDKIAKKSQRESDILEAIDRDLSSEPFDYTAYTKSLKERSMRRHPKVTSKGVNMVGKKILTWAIIMAMLASGVAFHKQVGDVLRAISNAFYDSIGTSYEGPYYHGMEPENEKTIDEGGAGLGGK